MAPWCETAQQETDGQSRELVSWGCKGMQAGRAARKETRAMERAEEEPNGKGAAEGKTQKPVPSQKVCEPKDVARTREN